MSKRVKRPIEPLWFEDIPWRVGYRLRWFVFHIFGPPQLSGDTDPHVRLARSREQRYAERARGRTDQGKVA